MLRLINISLTKILNYLLWLLFVGRPETDLVGHMEGLSENSNAVELDDVILNRNIEDILDNEAWASEAAYVNISSKYNCC